MSTKLSTSSLPLVGSHFSVDFGNGQTIKEHSFSEISIGELQLKTKSSESLIKGNKETLPDGYEFGDLKLKKGKTTTNSYLFKWLKVQIDFQKKLPLDIKVKLLNHKHEPFLIWTFENAFPYKYDTTGIIAKNSELIIDEISFKFDSFKFSEIEDIGPPLIRYEKRERKSEPVKLKSENKTKIKPPVKIKNDEYALTKNALRLARQMDGMLQKKPLKISPPKPKSSRVNRKTSQKKPPK